MMTTKAKQIWTTCVVVLGAIGAAAGIIMDVPDAIGRLEKYAPQWASNPNAKWVVAIALIAGIAIWLIWRKPASDDKSDLARPKSELGSEAQHLRSAHHENLDTRNWIAKQIDEHPWLDFLSVLLVGGLTLSFLAVSQATLTSKVLVTASVSGLVYLQFIGIRQVLKQHGNRWVTNSAVAVYVTVQGALILCVALLVISVAFNYPLHIRYWVEDLVPHSSSTPPPAAAPVSIDLLIKQGNTYYEEISKPYQDGTDAGQLKASQLIIVKESLEKISSKTDEWQSIVLEANSFVKTSTIAATYSIEINRIENHGTDLESKSSALVVYFGWISRTDADGWITLLPVQLKRDPTPLHLSLQCTLPETQAGDNLVICLQRHAKADPPTFTPNTTLTVSRIGK